ncbi:hypothetical protein LCGC14_2844830, partial [marine sediment metagenome]
EMQPWKVVKNNILGTSNIVEVTKKFNVERFVFVSTDKAVRPANVMGAFKLFDQVYVMRNEVIAQKVDVLMYYVYIKGLEEFKMGYAAAISVVIFISALILTFIIKRVIKYSV